MIYGRSYGKLIDIAAGILAIGAGAYLVQAKSLGTIAGGESWFQLLAHGIGVYFIARGIWMVRHAGHQEDVVGRLDRLIAIGDAFVEDDPNDPVEAV